ncbi:MAG: fibronectin type III domain-containing protein, partial [Acidimicrobiaceae bacterium]|nr:fibronectin type III domain-containing protein [Acidimicrobiaceae bacterium]
NTVTEGGSVAVTATLDRPATAAVSVTLSAASASTAASGDYTLPAAFTIAKGQSTATGTVRTVGDEVDEGNETIVLTTTVGGLSVTGVTLTIADDDTAGVTLSRRSVSAGEGSSATYTVVLDSEPTADVTVTPTSGATSKATVAPGSRTFTPANWDVAQTFTVTGVEAGTSVIAHAAASADSGYSISAVGTVSVSVSAVANAPSTLMSSTLTARDLGWLQGEGCVGLVQCSAQFPSSSVSFGGWDYDVLALRVVRGTLQVTFERAIPVHPDHLWLEVDGRVFRVKDASVGWGVGRNEDAWRLSWLGTGLSWSPGDTVAVRLVGRYVSDPGPPPPNVDLHPVRVHYDAVVGGEAVNGFVGLRLARPKPSTIPGTFIRRVVLRAYVPGTFAAADPDKGTVTTTHAMLRVRAHPASTLEWAIGDVYGVTGTFASFDNGGFTPAIALNPASKWTYVYLRVTNGAQTATHVVAIDPPPRTYTLTPKAGVTEGEEATLTVSLGSPAAAGGVSFAVSADYPDGGASAADVGTFAATVTVPEGRQSAAVVIPAVDDDEVEADEERFTVRVAHVGEPAWAVDPDGTDTAVVTIADNDEPPPPPAPPEGPEPWGIEVVPGDGTLTVTWNVGSRAGVDDSDIWHVLRWSQEFGVWANPRDPRAVGPNDGVSVGPGLTSYTITGLTNGVATGVFVRSMVGHRNNMSERDAKSSKWVRTKGDHTTPAAPPNNAPTVAAAIADTAIANQTGTRQVSLSGVFEDADGDDLTVTAASSADSVATVAVADHTLTVTAVSRGTTDITVTADDGAGGTVTDTFTVTVKAAPDVASPIADIGELETGTSRQISLSGVFSDPDGDTLTVSVTTSDRATADISAALDPTTLSATAVTVIGVAEGTATITLTAQDPDGNQVSDTFDVTVPAAREEPQQQQQAQQQQQEEEEEEEEPQQQAEAPPGQVVNLSVRQTQPTRIRVEWDPPHDGGTANSYQVVLLRDGEELSTRRPGAKKRHVVIRKLEPGATYTITVRAKNATGLGPETTAQITLTTEEAP